MSHLKSHRKKNTLQHSAIRNLEDAPEQYRDQQGTELLSSTNSHWGHLSHTHQQVIYKCRHVTFSDSMIHEPTVICDITPAQRHICNAHISSSSTNNVTSQTQETGILSPTNSFLGHLLCLIHLSESSQFEFVPRDTQESEFLDLVDFKDVAPSNEWNLS